MSASDLQKPDALMNPDIQNHIDEYINGGGDIGSMISYLSEGYKGNFHIIDAFGSLLQGLGVEFRASFENFLKEQIIQVFDQKTADLNFDVCNPPSWIDSLASNNLWVSIISELLKKYPSSIFLLYSFEKICQLSPHYVSMIPPCRISYNSYHLVISNRIPQLRAQFQNNSYNRKQLKNFLAMITADDLTIAHTAFLLDKDKDIALINAIIDALENRRPSQRIFLRTLMKLEDCDDEIIETLQSNKALGFETITQLSLLGTSSGFLQDFILRKMTKELLNPVYNESDRKLLIKSVLLLTSTTEVDEQLFIDGIQCFIKWNFSSSNEIALSLYASKIKFCAMAMLPVISNRILASDSTYFANNPKTPTVERLHLCEIAYWHHDLIPKVFHIIEKGLENSSSRRNLDNHVLHNMLGEFYDILVFLYEIGSYKNVLKIFTRKLSDSDSDLKRKSLIKILQKTMPPFSKEFLSHMLKCLTNPDVKALFFPSRGIAPLPVQKSGLEVLFRFTDRVNKDESSSSDPKERPIYDNLRASTRQAMEISNGQKQHTLTSYFRT